MPFVYLPAEAATEGSLTELLDRLCLAAAGAAFIDHWHLVHKLRLIVVLVFVVVFVFAGQSMRISLLSGTKGSGSKGASSRSTRRIQLAVVCIRPPAVAAAAS